MNEITDGIPRSKCMLCSIIIKDSDLEPDQKCPECGTVTIKMCPRDHCHCGHDITETMAYCPLCGKSCCPVCGSEDVVVLSRVTGYLQEVGGWNAGKQQELKDRTRVDVSNGLLETKRLPDMYMEKEHVAIN